MKVNATNYGLGGSSMYTLLIVDDEMIAVRAIAEGIDWSGLAISHIYTAYDYDEAAELLKLHTIDLLITDIEMPGKNGLELLEHAQSVNPHIVSLITTGHASFDYAHRAIGYGSMHYLLKPLDFAELRSLIAGAIAKLEEKRSLETFQDIYEQYNRQWNGQLPLLRERFWQDVVNQRVLLTQDKLEAQTTLYDIPVSYRSTIIPVLISVEEWRKELNTRDEEIMEYALRNAAAELILSTMQGQVIQERNGSSLVLIFTDSLDAMDHDGLLHSIRAGCEVYIRKCAEYFGCILSCYIGEPSPLDRLSHMFRNLINLERDNVTQPQSVLLYQPRIAEELPASLVLPDFDKWQTLLETGRKTELLDELARIFTSMAIAESVTSRTLKAFYTDYVQLIYKAAAAKNLRITDLECLRSEEEVPLYLRSLQHLQHWAVSVIEEYDELVRTHGVHYSEVVDQVIDYIGKHLDEEISREMIAEHVHLNSAYLSRLFKKETGMSLSDYIMKLRMDKAKELLREPQVKVSNVAASVGYTHFSHFAKMFKKSIGLTPQEYRKGLSSYDSDKLK
ncbi:helix-turn-helix domain-containing protein [Paenibacillus sp. GCM10023252]|uniref:response regulator transcription factor n=1 Tax=Paenibacillus sp. GCM10023252 TaxID=3252649 RepID=UPI00360AE944